MKILFVVSEIFSVAKTGGLADAVFGLARQLKRSGEDVRVLIPCYHAIKNARSFQYIDPITVKDVLPGHEVILSSGKTKVGSIPLLYVTSDAISEKEGDALYQDENGVEWPDNHIRFGLLSRVGAMIASGEIDLDWQPDVVHAHDWQAALTPWYIKKAKLSRPVATILTLHNLAFQGLFDSSVLPELAMSQEDFSSGAIEYWNKISFLKAGILSADEVVTVSPTYSKEILTPEFGMGLEGVIQTRSKPVLGILNGLDSDIWNPNRSPFVAQKFSLSDLSGRSVCKAALQKASGLEVDPDKVLIASASRLTHQKMADILYLTARELLLRRSEVQFIFAGRGDHEIETELMDLVQEFPGRVSCEFKKHESLFHKVHAGSDILMHGSRFEPCGLAHRYAMSFGSVPVVTRVGGLLDTVEDASVIEEGADKQTGFFADEITQPSFDHAIERALTTFQDKARWAQIQRNGMQREEGWVSSAKAYCDVYHSFVKAGNISRLPVRRLVSKQHIGLDDLAQSHLTEAAKASYKSA